MTEERKSKRKRIREARKARKSSFLANVAEDVLMQIFLCLPTSRSLIRCSAVCKHWHSLIHNNPSYHHFITRFNQYHRTTPSLDSLETSTLFHFRTHPQTSLFYELHSTKPCDLSFMPNHNYLVVRASCRDLLLVAYGTKKFYVCNFRSRHWFLLPAFPFQDIFKQGNWGYALVCHSQNSYTYKVLIFCCNHFERRFYTIIFGIFHSETGLWTRNHFSQPYVLPRIGRTMQFKFICFQVVTTTKGIVHWLDGTKGIYCLAAFDPFTHNLSLIPLPSAQFRAILPHHPQGRVCIGVVHDRLRLLLMEQLNPVRFCFKIWELDSSNDSWTLVHHYLQTFTDAANCRAYFVHSFDPLNDNVIYLVRGKKIRRFEIGQNKDVGICKFMWDGGSVDEGETWRVAATCMRVFPLLHPLWPTPISAPPSSI